MSDGNDHDIGIRHEIVDEVGEPFDYPRAGAWSETATSDLGKTASCSAAAMILPTTLAAADRFSLPIQTRMLVRSRTACGV
jgi:hypothetical protein